MKDLSAFCRLLGDDVRLRLIRLLGKEQLNVKELTAILGIAQSGVSRHLGLLRKSGLVEERREMRLHPENPPTIVQEVDYAEGSAAAWWPRVDPPVIAPQSARAAADTIAPMTLGEPCLASSSELITSIGAG